MSRRPSRAGFSLIESVVAVAILGLMLPLLFQSIHSAVGFMATTERREIEWRLADDLMTEATATLDSKEGTREGRDGALAWSIETMPADENMGGGPTNDGTGDTLFRVRVSVRPVGGPASDPPVTLDTLRLWTAPR